MPPLLEHYLKTRRVTETLCRDLETEDYVIQAAPFVSPPRWHLAHTTWFLEQFVLREFEKNFGPFDPRFQHLFNSYYETVGTYFERPRRGTLSRPTVEEVYRYRKETDQRICELLEGATREHERDNPIGQLIELGIHHEQQHQELLITDTLFNFWSNPIRPAMFSGGPAPRAHATPEGTWREFPGAEIEIGHRSGEFSFDNETPSHRVWIAPFRLSSRLVTNGEYADFIEDGGYERHEFWLSDAWRTVQEQRWRSPLYWEEDCAMTVYGMRERDPAAPVTHVSYYEADAFARWKGARLPSEQEWESVAGKLPLEGNLLESEIIEARPARLHGAPIQQLFGDAWEWTMSPYVPYPGFRPPKGALGEYNAKFMCNQLVLRGGSCATPREHLRATYRNFFSPETRWQFSGIRLAHD